MDTVTHFFQQELFMDPKTISFGGARRIITPRVPMSLAGYFNLRMFTEVLDDLEVRVLVLRHGKKAFLLIQFDLITVTTELYESIRAEIKDLALFDETNILMTATHTHTGPDYRKSCPLHGSDDQKKYFSFLVKQTGDAVREAAGIRRTGTLSYGMTSDVRFLFNRRYWMKNGKVVTNPGKLNAEIKRPEGEIDPEIPLCAISDESGKIAVLLAGIVNHTDTIGGTGVSADWAGFTRRALEKNMSPDGIMFPLIGAAGNINHFDVSNNTNQTCYAEAERIGNGYAETIAKALPSLENTDAEPFRIYSATAVVSDAEISREELAGARATVEKYSSVPSPEEAGITLTSEDLANGNPVALKYFAQCLLNTYEEKRRFSFLLTGLEMGHIMIASLPSEPFVEIGLKLRKDLFPDKCCFAVSHGNGTGHREEGGGYIPNSWNFGRGGYETEISSDPYERRTAAKLINAWKKPGIV